MSARKKESTTKETIIMALGELETMGIWTTKEVGNLPNEHEPWSPWCTPSAPCQARGNAKSEYGALLSGTHT